MSACVLFRSKTTTPRPLSPRPLSPSFTTCLKVAPPLKQNLVHLERQPLPRPHCAQLGEPLPFGHPHARRRRARFGVAHVGPGGARGWWEQGGGRGRRGASARRLARRAGGGRRAGGARRGGWVRPVWRRPTSPSGGGGARVGGEAGGAEEWSEIRFSSRLRFGKTNAIMDLPPLPPHLVLRQLEKGDYDKGRQTKEAGGRRTRGVCFSKHKMGAILRSPRLSAAAGPADRGGRRVARDV